MKRTINKNALWKILYEKKWGKSLTIENFSKIQSWKKKYWFRAQTETNFQLGEFTNKQIINAHKSNVLLIKIIENLVLCASWDSTVLFFHFSFLSLTFSINHLD